MKKMMIHGSLDQPESGPKRHLDLFSLFCTSHPYTQHTDTNTYTDYATRDICSNRPHFVHYVQAMRPNNTRVYVAVVIDSSHCDSSPDSFADP